MTKHTSEDLLDVIANIQEVRDAADRRAQPVRDVAAMIASQIPPGAPSKDLLVRFIKDAASAL